MTEKNNFKLLQLKVENNHNNISCFFSKNID